MPHSVRPVRLSFQTKVLIPVVGIMVLLVVLPTWLVTRRLSRQFETVAAENLATADAVFRNLRPIQARNLLLRYRNAANDPRFKAAAKLAHEPTLRFQLKELLEELGGDAVLYFDAHGEPVAKASRLPALDPSRLAGLGADSIRLALGNEANVTTIDADGRLFDLVSVPVLAGEEVVGGLTFASELGEEAVREFKQLTRSEIVLLAGNQIAAGTLVATNLTAELAQTVPDKAAAHHADTVTVNGEHFMYLAGELGQAASGPRLGYLLLSSYEQPLLELQATQRQFLWIQFAGILLGTTVVWLLVRRVTNPLRQLRDSAEAVGRGDFSQRVEVRSRDECGELAGVFNRMTANLKTSREQLEKTVETLSSTQAQLIQSEKLRAIGTLAGGIAHDFNNMLGAILGFGELALEDVPRDSSTARNLRQVLKAGQRAKDLVRQILAFSRQSAPQRVKVRLSAIIDETARLLRATIPATIEIHTRLDTTEDVVIADPTQLHQVLMNLGTNASHAMRNGGGELTFALDEFSVPEGGAPEAPQLKPGSYLRLRVADTGHGMEQSVQERIFEPFFTTKPVGEGTGLGLSVVHGIIENHGGLITVKSAPDKGTTFAIFLPHVQLGAFVASEGIDEPIRGGTERILVVDDEESLANMMQQRLSRLGYDVVAHHDSVAALDEFRTTSTPFNLVITDQAMPKLTGTGLAAEVVRLHAHTPVIIVTGSSHTLSEAELMRPAVRECLTKPVNFAELSRAIRKALEEKPEAPGSSN